MGGGETRLYCNDHFTGFNAAASAAAAAAATQRKRSTPNKRVSGAPAHAEPTNMNGPLRENVSFDDSQLINLYFLFLSRFSSHEFFALLTQFDRARAVCTPLSNRNHDRSLVYSWARLLRHPRRQPRRRLHAVHLTKSSASPRSAIV